MAEDLELAYELAELADSITGRHFEAGPVAWQSKPDGSPVIAVDVEVEESLLTLVASRRPQDAFLGEEVGSIGTGHRRWIVDGAAWSGQRFWARSALVGRALAGRMDGLPG